MRLATLFSRNEILTLMPYNSQISLGHLVISKVVNSGMELIRRLTVLIFNCLSTLVSSTLLGFFHSLLVSLCADQHCLIVLVSLCAIPLVLVMARLNAFSSNY